jgi:phosphoribosylformylglycinamidine (FGAM) synthase-like amidotransferase family enzyme
MVFKLEIISGGKAIQAFTDNTYAQFKSKLFYINSASNIDEFLKTLIILLLL